MVDGMLRLLFGIQIPTGQPEDFFVVLIIASALVLFMASRHLRCEGTVHNGLGYW